MRSMDFKISYRSLLNRKSTGAQSLGDFIPLPNDENRPRKRYNTV